MLSKSQHQYPLLKARLVSTWDSWGYFRFSTAAQLHVAFFVLAWRMPEEA